ncbi:MAG TPA: hypothetical protein VF605_16865 [Allosphingosinicella sp.]|jgi:hypothetical protein
MQSLAASLEVWFQGLSVLLAVLAAIASFIYGFRNVKSAKQANSLSSQEIRDAVVEFRTAAREGRPFETTALENYYGQVLSRANISFWFSLVFASIGFGVIIFAFVTHNTADVTGTIIKVVSGTVIDAISGLFFVQSTSAQKSMAEFFEKLRLDRLNAEARDMIAEIEDSKLRDELRAQLILKYSGIDRLLTGTGTGKAEA